MDSLKKYLASGKWADPHSASYTNGYDKAIREEILFLESLLTSKDMTQQEMFEKSFERPSNFFELNPQEQWAIDKQSRLERSNPGKFSPISKSL